MPDFGSFCEAFKVAVLNHQLQEDEALENNRAMAPLLLIADSASTVALVREHLLLPDFSHAGFMDFLTRKLSGLGPRGTAFARSVYRRATGCIDLEGGSIGCVIMVSMVIQVQGRKDGHRVEFCSTGLKGMRDRLVARLAASSSIEEVFAPTGLLSNESARRFDPVDNYRLLHEVLHGRTCLDQAFPEAPDASIEGAGRFLFERYYPVILRFRPGKGVLPAAEMADIRAIVEDALTASDDVVLRYFDICEPHDAFRRVSIKGPEVAIYSAIESHLQNGIAPSSLDVVLVAEHEGRGRFASTGCWDIFHRDDQDCLSSFEIPCFEYQTPDELASRVRHVLLEKYGIQSFSIRFIQSELPHVGSLNFSVSGSNLIIH